MKTGALVAAELRRMAKKIRRSIMQAYDVRRIATNDGLEQAAEMLERRAKRLEKTNAA